MLLDHYRHAFQDELLGTVEPHITFGIRNTNARFFTTRKSPSLVGSGTWI
jgi:hypothetical protein